MVIYWSIFITSFLSYLFILWGIIRVKGEGQSFYTWVLWLFLDIVLIIPTLQKGGVSALMLFSSIIGSLVISSVLLYMKKVEWKRSETLSSVLLIITLIVWYFSSDKDTVIVCGVASQVIAGLPLTKMSWVKPEPVYILGYLFFIFGCIFSLTLKNNVLRVFVLEDHLFPISLGLQTIIDIIPLVLCLKRYRK